jgi:hypothetical protein
MQSPTYLRHRLNFVLPSPLSSPKEVGELCKQMLGYKLQTKQTTGDGVLVRNVSL